MDLQTMGMAIMLDEIINYVQSLQHQVEVSDKKKKSEWSKEYLKRNIKIT